MLSLFDCTCYQKELALLIVDEAEFLEAALAVEKEAIEVAIDAAVAVLCGY